MEERSVAAASWFRWPGVRAIFDCINRDGFEVRAVGGAVRNGLLGLAVKDVDFATTALPADTMRLASRAGLRAVPTGLDHGTLTLIAGGVPFEVTALRRDVKTDGRRAIVEFGGDWAEDAGRRDFTVNSLLADADGRVYDLLGIGLRDLDARSVRFIGEPEARIREDYLRILRFFRFSADYTSGDFDAAGVEACVRGRAGLARLSRERVRSEIFGILVAKRADEAVRILNETGLLTRLTGGITRFARFENLIALENAFGFAPNPVLRLAALTLFVLEDAARLADRLRLSSAEAVELGALGDHESGAMQRPRPESLQKALYRQGAETFRGRTLIAWAASGDSPGDLTWREAVAAANRWKRPDFPVRGGDLIQRGQAPGKELGAELKRLEERWIASGFALSRDELLAARSSD